MNKRLLRFIIPWSIGLFVATFPGVLKSKIDFMNSDFETILFPIGMIFVLYLWELAYSISEKDGVNSIEKNNVAIILIIISISFLSLFLFQLFGNIFLKYSLLIICWTFISALKYYAYIVAEKKVVNLKIPS